MRARRDDADPTSRNSPRPARHAAVAGPALLLTLLLALPAGVLAQQGKAKGKDRGPDGQDGRRPADARTADASWWSPAASHYASLGWTDGREGPVAILGNLELPTASRRSRPGRGNLPSFCRTGAGHPRFGRRWCVEKGFGLGGGLRLGDLGDITLRQHDRRLEEPDLLDVLGGVFVDRVRDALGLPDVRLEGRYAADGGGGTVLQLRSAGRPVAELADGDGDGRVEAVILSAEGATTGR